MLFSILLQHPDIGEKCTQADHQCGIEYSQQLYPVQKLFRQSGRRPVHHILFTFQKRKGFVQRTVSDKIDPENLYRIKRQRQPHQDRSGNEDHLIQTRRDKEIDRFSDIAGDGTSLPDRIDDDSEVVLGQHHFGSGFGCIGTIPHSDPQIRSFEGRHIVGPVSRHGDDLPLRLKHLDDTILVLRKHSCPDRHHRQDLPEFLIIHRIELFAGDYPVPLFVYGNGFCYSCCGQRIVSCDHHHSDSGPLCCSYRLCHTLFGRVQETHHPDNLDLPLRDIIRRMISHTQRDDPQPLTGHPVMLSLQSFKILPVGSELFERFKGTFDKQFMLFFNDIGTCHQPVSGVERIEIDARILLSDIVIRFPDPDCKGPVHRISLPLYRFVGKRRNSLCKGLMKRENLLYFEFALGDRACLVCRDNRSAAQCLDGR